jgi:hypothetical protein
MTETNDTQAPATVAKESELTAMVQGDLDDLINTASNPTAKPDKIEFGGSDELVNKKAEQQKAIIRERKIPHSITATVFFILVISGVLYV